MEQIMISKAFLIPTGNEIKDGTVLDLDCPKIMEQLVRLNPEMEVTRLSPVVDVEERIVETMQICLKNHADLIVLVGGSGGGHRFSETLGKDFTHSAMEMWLDQKVAHEIYGKNGHMWSKLICGKKGDCFVVNVPGPLREATAAAKALVESLRESGDIHVINTAMSDAVFQQYPQEKVERNVEL